MGAVKGEKAEKRCSLLLVFIGYALLSFTHTDSESVFLWNKWFVSCVLSSYLSAFSLSPPLPFPSPILPLSPPGSLSFLPRSPLSSLTPSLHLPALLKAKESLKPKC